MDGTGALCLTAWSLSPSLLTSLGLQQQFNKPGRAPQSELHCTTLCFQEPAPPNQQERVPSSQPGLDLVTWQDSSLLRPNSSSSCDPLQEYTKLGAQARRTGILLSQSNHTHTRTGGKPGRASSTNGTDSRSPYGRSLTNSVSAWRAGALPETEGSTPDRCRGCTLNSVHWGEVWVQDPQGEAPCPDRSCLELDRTILPSPAILDPRAWRATWRDCHCE